VKPNEQLEQQLHVLAASPRQEAVGVSSGVHRDGKAISVVLFLRAPTAELLARVLHTGAHVLALMSTQEVPASVGVLLRKWVVLRVVMVTYPRGGIARSQGERIAVRASLIWGLHIHDKVRLGLLNGHNSHRDR
jgi:hypothetical protein